MKLTNEHLLNVIVDLEPGYTLHLRKESDEILILTARSLMTSKEWNVTNEWLQKAKQEIEKLILDGKFQSKLYEQENHFENIKFDCGYIDNMFLGWCKIACSYIKRVPIDKINDNEKIMLQIMFLTRFGNDQFKS